MAIITEHALENIKNYKKLVAASEMKALGELVRHNWQNSESTACVVYLANPVSNPHRNDWAPNDAICAIIRNNQVVTVMMTRRNQINKGHLRTSRIVD